MIFSAHGVPKSIPVESQRRNFFSFDATCPLVTKVHREAEIHHKRGREIVLIGHAGHPEVVGTLGQLPDGAITLVQTVEEAEAFQPRDVSKLSYVTQTTLSLDDTADIVATLKRRFPTIVAPHKEDICYATTNRQEAVKRVAPQVDALVVVGAPNSSNSQAASRGRRARRLLLFGAWCNARPRSTGRSSKASRRLASPPARRRPRCWSRKFSMRSRRATR